MTDKYHGIPSRVEATAKGVVLTTLEGIEYYSRKYSKGRRARNILARNGISMNRFRIHTSKGHKVRYYAVSDKIVFVYKPSDQESKEKRNV